MEKNQTEGMRNVAAVLFLLFLMPVVIADTHYTREHSKELFDLIEWQPYAASTFAHALEEKKPIYLVISAPAWCYWCHVYESEDYLFHPSLYPYINDEFVPIFVDSDKRPDLTKKYLEGGWPSTTLLTPDLQRLNGFTGPREPIALREYLQQVVAFVDHTDFSQSILDLSYDERGPYSFDLSHLKKYRADFISRSKSMYDKTYGGIGMGTLPEWREGQKFPQPLTHAFLISEYLSKADRTLLDISLSTFEHQFTPLERFDEQYHLYDPIEGGYHRYSTKRDWSVPHYEKMISDQAGFLQMLGLLHKADSSADVATALNGTLDFVMRTFTDGRGFFSSSDAHLEHTYFDLDAAGRESLGKPYVDPTKLMDGNARMIDALLLLHSLYGWQDVKDAAKNALDFMADEMVGEGALYYVDTSGESGLAGQGLANSYGLLAFVRGYEALSDETYLHTAISIADFSLDRLYDWKHGGFFVRNSPDATMYAPNERVDLSKSSDENAVFAYGFLKLYTFTSNELYLDAGMKALGNVLASGGSFDASTYALRAIDLIEKGDLLLAYEDIDISSVIITRLDKFWVDELLAQQSRGVSLDGAPTLPNEFAGVGFLVLVLLAFLTGILSFLSPCTLPVLTAYFAQIAGSNRKRVLVHTVAFLLGLALIFSVFGMGATFIGLLFRDARVVLTKFAGLLIVGLGFMQLLGRGFKGVSVHVSKRKDFLGSFLFGIVFGIGWSACVGPILASLLLLSATAGTVMQGSFLLFVYALGLGLPLVLIALWFESIKMTWFWKFLQGRMVTITLFGKTLHLHTMYVVSGMLLIVLGVLIYQDFLFRLNSVALQSGFVQDVIIRGEEFLRRLFVR